MGLDPELTEIFLDEARAHLAVLVDRARPRQARVAAAEGLAAAAALCGLAEVEGRAELAARALAALDEATVAATAAGLEPLLVGLAAPRQGGGPRAEGFAPAELDELLAAFREEAAEHLDRVQAALAELDRDPGRRALVDEILRKAHTLKGSASMVGLAPVSEAAHALESVLVLLRSGALRGPAVVAQLQAAIDGLRALLPVAHLPGASARAATLCAGLASLRAGVGPPAAAAPSSIVVHGVDTLDERGGRRREDQTVVLRVDPARLDRLMDAVGELVFDRTRIERRVGELRTLLRELGRARSGVRALVRQHRLPRLAELENEMASQVAHLARVGSALLDDADALRRTTRMLQDGLTQVRMMKVRWLFQRVARPLRDLERLEGKRAAVMTAGGDTELDKAVVERVADPLLQLLRNALAHGIEPVAERLALGKPAEGRITLSARHEGESVFLEVADDGAGIDADRVRSSLVASGRMTAQAAAAAPDEDIVATIFQPGVSTRDEADELAGRGVGLDVVHETIAGLGGEITVASTPGQGTRFTLRLPLTTAISQAFLFKVGGHVYALPGAHLVATEHLGGSALEVPPTLLHGGQALPLVSLHRVLGVEPVVGLPGVPVLVLEFAGRRLAASCDKVVGPREIVVKSLGPLLAPLGLYAGATISGAGKVQLILDPAALVRIAYPPALPSGETGLHAPVPAAGVAAGAVAAEATAARPRVLVADDSRTVREALARVLSAGGYVVDLATDGQEAWDMLHEVHYDVLVTDLEMPRLGGAELVARLRADGTLGRLPVVAISSRTEAPPSADAFLAKPVPHRALVREVERLLGR